MTNHETPDPTAAIEVLARLLCSADVHVHGDEHPTWQQMVGEPGQRIRDNYRKVARWLLPRMTVAARPAAVSVPPPAPRADDRGALRDRIAEAEERAARYLFEQEWTRTIDHDAARQLLAAVLPEPADAPVAECSAQNRNYESGPRLCIRAAQHHGDHIDDRGFHWSDTVAVYPLGDGTFRTGVNLRAALRRAAAVSGPCVAGEQQNETPEAEAEVCAHCGKTILRRTATLTEWWVHAPGGHTMCAPEQAASSPRATPRPAVGVRQDGAQPQEQPVVAYRSDGGRLLNCLRHVPPPAARHADFHPVTAEDLPDGGICTYSDCGRDVLAGPHP